MTFDNILTLLIIVGLGYMMFRGGGCCGGHGGHGKHGGYGEDKDSKTGSGKKFQDHPDH